MNKSAIRNFAVNARKKLIDDVKQKAYQLGITESEVKEPEVYQDGFRINQQFYKKYEIKQREKLLNQIEAKGFEHVMEEVAYTWFNRFIAIRFMEVNDYLPTGVRLFSSIIEGKTEPDAVSEVDMIAHDLELDMDLVYQLQDANDTEGLFKYILVKQCNKLGEIMPVVFERIADYTELLLPDQLLSEGSVIRDMVDMIDESDWKEEVEIIGWLYQYYISEKKDEVFEGLRKRKKITKENIPAATQLFTPKWIVQYMVENSLGRLWLESHPNEQLQANWEYYIEEAEQEPEVQDELDKLKDPTLKPEDITILDPAVGSGHILVYAFDVLYEIYETAGYAKRDIPKLILENNVYGLDIDDRAAQLAYFALLMKSCRYNRRILDEPIKLQVRAIQQSNNITKDMLENVLQKSEYDGDKKKLQAVLESIIDVFYDAKEYGSILNVEEHDYELAEDWLETLKNEHFNDMFVEHDKDQILEVLPDLIHQAKIMSKKYDVTITNPPYMGRGGMNPKLTKFLDKHYKDSKSDLFAVFIEKGFEYIKATGFNSMVTMQSWMFLSTFEKMRIKLLNNKTILTLLHMDNMVMGIAFGTAATIFRNIKLEGLKGYFTQVKYTNLNDDNEPINFPIEENQNGIVPSKDFNNIPGSPVAYWLNKKIFNIFKISESLIDVIDIKQGSTLGNNELFLRFWYEIEKGNENKRWFPCLKGGPYRRWYGNHYYYVNWENDGEEIKKTGRATIRNRKFLFNEGISWSRVTSGLPSFRIMEKGFFFESASGVCFPSKDLTLYILGFLNSKLTTFFLESINSTITIQSGDISKLPFIESDTSKIDNVVERNITIAKQDWDSFETSWDFKRHPFINGEPTIKQAYEKWTREAEERFQTLKANEEELNRIFIDIYGLQDELTPEVEDKDVTVRKADLERDVKSFISYAVGCMLGRYSLDEEGLIYAGGEFDPSKYTSFPADEDNVIPITDEDYFDDDIVARFVEFVRTVYGEESLEDNLEFIAEALSKRDNETARQRIRRYFLNEFYTAHVRIYQKRPIYWQFDSGRQNGFKALVYMHRYDSNLVARVRTEYLHMLQRKYESEMQRLNGVIDSDVSKTEKRAATKQKEKLQKQLSECREYDQVIAHIANQRIEIDLDDGVKVNYAKFQNIEVPQGEGKAPLKNNLLKKI